MPKKVAAPKSKFAAVDFDSFMKGVLGSDSVVDLSKREDTFYKLGDYSLDRAHGGGLPVGQIYTFSGEAQTCKTLSALCVCKSVIASGKKAMYIDVENKISTKCLRSMGLQNNPEFIMLSIGNLEETLDKVMQFLESEFFGVIVIDSVDALTTDEQDEREIHEGSKVGGYKAKVFSEWLGKVSQLGAGHECSVLMIRQLRDNPGVMYGSTKTMSGGKAIGYYTTTAIEFSRTSADKKRDVERDGHTLYWGVSALITKMNQGIPPKDKIPLRYAIGDGMEWGIDPIQSLSAEAQRLGIIATRKAGSHMYYGSDELCEMLDVAPDELKFNGEGNMNAAITNDEVLQNAVKELVDKHEADGDSFSLPLDEDGDELAVDFEDSEE